MSNQLSLQSIVIDRSSPMPAYQQIASSLIHRIGQGEWGIDERIPSENDLADSYGVSRVTMRQALALLEKDEIIQKVQGRGIFIKANPRVFVQDLVFPSVENGPQPREILPSRVLRFEALDVAPVKVRSKLGLAPDDGVTYLQRLFCPQDCVIGINEAWFPTALVPGFAEKGLVKSSIIATLKKRYQWEIGSVDNDIEAVKLDAQYAKLLETQYDASALKIDTIYSLRDGRPIQYANTLWRGDVTRFHYRANRED